MQKTVIESRFLDVADWPKLAPFFVGAPDKMPDPLTALIAGAFLDGVLVGFVHITPTFLIKNAWSLRDDAMQGIMQLIDTVIGESGPQEYVLVTADASHAEGLWEKGYERIPCEVWRKRL